MDNNKGQTIFLSVIGIATLLVAIIGATFAWFSVNVTGNLEASSIIVTTAILGSIVFTDGSLIDLSNVRPEDTPTATKTFTVENTVSTLTKPIEYYVNLEVDENDLSENVNGGANNGDWFVHSLVGSVVEGDPTSEGDVLIQMAETGVPAGNDTRTKLGNMNGIMIGAAKHTYVYTIKFMDNHSDQNDGQGKHFYGKLQVYTTDSGSI